MKENSNIINLVPNTKPTEKVDNKVSSPAKYHTNPIFKKMFVISAKNISNKFSVSDLFE